MEPNKLSAKKEESSSTFSSTPFIGEVADEVLFMSHGEVCIYKNISRSYKWTLGGLFTKMPLKATNSPQILFCESY